MNYALDTERKIFVKVIFFLSRVGESDAVKGNDRRRKLANVFESKVEWTGSFDLLDETSSLHLIDDLLLRLGLLDEVRVGASRGNEPMFSSEC
jgi:hypothetical protein